MRLYKMIASCAGIGYIKGGGTIAAVFYTILWCLIRPPVNTTLLQAVVLVLVVAAGILIANRLEVVWGKDSNKIVIDEVAGMCCTLLFIPHHWKYALTGLLLFRFFDIAKPLFIRSVEKLPGGWGVMGDDMVAGIYANLVLQFILVSNIL